MKQYRYSEGDFILFYFLTTIPTDILYSTCRNVCDYSYSLPDYCLTAILALKNHCCTMPKITEPSEMLFMLSRAFGPLRKAAKATSLMTELNRVTSTTLSSTCACSKPISSNSLTRNKAYPVACSNST